jgi:gluconate 2-dehydrogenase alpha chain
MTSRNRYDRFDKLCAVSGKAGNLKGQKIEGGNIFEGPRSDEYPCAPHKTSEGGLMVAEACKSLGYHPFPAPFGGASTPYTNIYGVTIGGCEYCGFCGRTACEANAKASTPTNIMPALRGDPNCASFRDLRRQRVVAAL